MRRVVFYLFIIAVFLAAPLAALPRRGETAPAATTAPTATAEPTAAAPYRAVWVSYLEWQQVDFSTPETFSGDIAVILDNIRDLGATVVAQAALWGCTLPQQLLPIQPPLHRAAGRDPALTRWPCWCRPPTTGACTGSLGQPLPHPGWADPGALRRQPGQAAPRLGQIHRHRPTWTRPTRRCGST